MFDHYSVVLDWVDNLKNKSQGSTIISNWLPQYGSVVHVKPFYHILKVKSGLTLYTWRKLVVANRNIALNQIEFYVEATLLNVLKVKTYKDAT